MLNSFWFSQLDLHAHRPQSALFYNKQISREKKIVNKLKKNSRNTIGKLIFNLIA